MNVNPEFKQTLSIIGFLETRKEGGADITSVLTNGTGFVFLFVLSELVPSSLKESPLLDASLAKILFYLKLR